MGNKKGSVLIEIIIAIFIVVGLFIGLYNYTKQKVSKQEISKTLDSRSDVPVLILNNLEKPAIKEVISKKTPQEIILGQFKTNYFFEENIKLLKENNLNPQHRTLSNGHRQIFLKVSGSTSSVLKQLQVYKSLKIVPKDAFIKFK